MNGSPDLRPSATAPASGLPLGQIIPGTRYRVLSKLGEGGMGAVYAAEHVDLEKRVALKVLRSDAALAPKTIERFRDEARAASKIGSQFICDVTDFGQTPDGRVFYVMEYLEGASLGRMLKHEGRMRPERALPILRQVAKALHAAHEKGIVHLDIKPDNIMVFTRGKRADAVKVVDFGIARLLNTQKKDEKVAGTPEYMAPERFIGLGYDHRADVYSLGALAYEMLAGSVPLQGPTYIATLTMQVQELPTPVERRAPDAKIPDALAGLVMQMLEKDPGARPSSMAVVEAMLCEAQIAAGLRTAWDDLELPAVDEAWQKKLAERMPSPWGRQKKALLVSAIGVALLASGVATYYALRPPEKETIYVPVTKSSEAKAVAEWIEKAYAAAESQHYTKPAGESALAYIVRAEEEHARNADRDNPRSKGAETLRRALASALAVAGDELLKYNLREVAIVKYKEALLFTPDDEKLMAKAELSPEDKSSLRERARAPVSGKVTHPKVVSLEESRATEARETAAVVFDHVRGKRFSLARNQLRKLAGLDKNGLLGAQLADAFRGKAADLWARGARAEARPLYQLVADLDPEDTEARTRASEQAEAAPSPASEPPAPARPESPLAPGAEAPAGRSRPAPREEPEIHEAPRNTAASRAATQDGLAALKRLRLAEAETAFNRALKADPGNSVAMGGLAEVAFERSRYTEALDYARRASKLGPRNTKYLVLLGDAYFKLLRYGEAQSAYERARAVKPDDPVVAGRLERVRNKLRE